MAYDETRTDIDQFAIAAEQLEVAIELFLSGRSFASAVTLAGAADGVFQKALAARKEQTSLETSFEAMDQLQAVAPKFGEIKSNLDRKARFKAFCDRRNLERDLFKHGPRKRRDDRYQMPRMHPDLQEAACEMIVRADDDRKRLGLPETSNANDFNEWFYREVVGY